MRRTIAAIPVCVLLIFEFRYFDEFLFPVRVLWSEQAYLTLALSVAVFLCAVVSVFLMFFSDRSLVRKLTLPVFIFFFLFNIGSLTTSNAPLDFHQTVTIVNNFQWWFWEVVENFGIAVLPLLLVLVPAIVLIERLPKYLQLGIPGTAYLAPLGTLLLTCLGLQLSNGLFDRYPSFFRVPSMFVYASQSDLDTDNRSPVAYATALEPQVEKIVLIVDESIRADILGINGEVHSTTPFLRSMHRGIVNFGQAASASNCSDYSNLIVRTGIRREEIPDKERATLRKPSVWQYAKKAGYETVYLDAQNAQEWNNYQNFMDAQEASGIDSLLRLRQRVAHQSDLIALEKLVDYLSSPGRSFIILNKYGMHFPYFRSYPEDFEFFTPALEPHEPMQDRERAMNSYMNGIRWSVDHWFQLLFAASADFRPYVIIYTSDHGQNIVDDGTLATHCRPAATRFEGLVPMVVMSSEADILERLLAMQPESLNRTSHFQIFPTLLELAGYHKFWIRERYGASLTDSPTFTPQFFVGDIYGRGSVRRWMTIYPP